MILDLPEVTQVAKNSSVSFRQLPPVITSNVRVVHCQNQQTDRGTILLTRPYLNLIHFYQHSFFFFFLMNLRNLGLPRWLSGRAWAQSTCPELSAQGLVPLRWGCALPSANAPGKAPNHIHTTLRWGLKCPYFLLCVPRGFKFYCGY